ncbi:CpaF family protein [Novipirellula sp. SH528]|uniref:CpaF family protein n=1 Tax=Novipirellula sp. SH528 TaxID=3454466 RepID=UPI003FA185FA
MNHEQLYETTLQYFLSPIWDLMLDDSVTEIMVNGPDNIYVERAGRVTRTDRHFGTDEFLLAAARNLAEYIGRPIEGASLSMDGRLPNGSRIHLILPPISRVGICLTIRKFREAAFTLPELIQMGSVVPEAADLLRNAIAEHKNIVVAGGTGTGKTSLLNALSREIDERERIVVIEESSELKLVQPHTVYLEALAAGTEGAEKATLRELFVNALRMRPDRILIGEVRRGEALELIQSMLSGHSGSLSTLHASSPAAAATRLETLCMLNDAQLPVYVARAQVAAAVDLFVQATRLPSGERCLTEIAELIGLDAQQNYVWKTLYKKSQEEISKTVSSLSEHGNLIAQAG